MSELCLKTLHCSQTAYCIGSKFSARSLRYKVAELRFGSLTSTHHSRLIATSLFSYIYCSLLPGRGNYVLFLRCFPVHTFPLVSLPRNTCLLSLPQKNCGFAPEGLLLSVLFYFWKPVRLIAHLSDIWVISDSLGFILFSVWCYIIFI